MSDVGDASDVRDVREKPARRAAPGLRLQILLALAGVILVAYVPLFFAVAQITRATSLSYREGTARALGRAVAAHVGDVRRAEPEALSRTVASHVGPGGALAIAVYGDHGEPIASAGPATELGAMRAPSPPYGETVQRVASKAGRAIDVTLPSSGIAVVVRVATEDDASSGGLVRGIALYMSVFAFALLVFAYIVLTRAIVRPIERLGRAADRVASGTRGFEVPDAGAREIAELGASVRSMAQRLLSDERAMRNKVEELTTTTRRLSETREQLEGSERMASVGKLAAGVAHEIGNPIAAIMGMHDLMDDSLLSDEDKADFLRRMRKETERIHVVVRDLLDYARPEAEAPSGHIASAEVAVVVADALALVRPQKAWRNVEATVSVDDRLKVMLSPQRLTQVLLNLLLNAGAALGGSPGDVARTVVVRASRTSSGPDASVRIEIEDNGPGVPKELRDRIFQPFVTTKDVGDGTGLGLAVCRGIVEGAKGKIFVDPDFTGGARFVVELPAS